MTSARSSRGSDALSAFDWGVRKYAWVLLGSVALVAAIGPGIALLRPQIHDAKALVVAKDLGTLSATTLPRYGPANFGEEVKRAVAARFGDDSDFDVIVPNRVSLVADQNSVVYHVVGHDPSAQTAADIANVAADAFISELNASGPQVGVFELQSEATASLATVAPLTSAKIVVPVSLGAGLALGLALVAGLIVLWRPVIDADDAERETGLPVLGTVALRAMGRNGVPLDPSPLGLVLVCRRLLALPSRTIVLVGADDSYRARQQLAIALYSSLRRVRPIRLIAEPGVARMADMARTTDELPQRLRHARSGQESPLTLVAGKDSPAAAEVVRDDDSTIILVISSGIGLGALKSTIAEHVGGSMNARLILIRHSRRRMRDVDERTPALARRRNMLSARRRRSVPPDRSFAAGP